MAGQKLVLGHDLKGSYFCHMRVPRGPGDLEAGSTYCPQGSLFQGQDAPHLQVSTALVPTDLVSDGQIGARGQNPGWTSLIPSQSTFCVQSDSCYIGSTNFFF